MDFWTTSRKGGRRRLKLLRYIVPLGAAGALTLMLAGVAAGVGVDGRVSTDSVGSEGNGTSWAASISADGRYVAFSSYASNLVSNLVYLDTNGKSDIFVKDIRTGGMKRVSVAANQEQADNHSYQPVLSGDGQYVVFHSSASNLLGSGNDSNGTNDIFLKNARDPNVEPTRISVSHILNQQANGSSTNPDITPDALIVVYQSAASNLVGGDINGKSDIFIRDRRINNASTPGSTVLVSVDKDDWSSNDNSTDPVVSDDGNNVAFASAASDLVGGDTNGKTDIFVRDLKNSDTKLVSVDAAGGDANGHSYNPSISADGRYIAFESDAKDLLGNDISINEYRHIFVRDTDTNSTTIVSKGPEGDGNGISYNPSISADGRYVTFRSAASNLVAGDTNNAYDVFVVDMGVQPRTITRLSLKADGSEASSLSSSSQPAISDDGSRVAFESNATNLVESDSNGTADIFTAAVNRTYYFPWYDNNPALGMRGNWIMLNNRDVSEATVDIFIGATQVASGIKVPPGTAYPWTAPDVRTSGPVKVFSRTGERLSVSQRVLYLDSFNEVEGLESTGLEHEYYFPWHDNNPAKGMNGDWIMVANMGTTATSVNVYLGDMNSPAASNLPVAAGGILVWQAPQVWTGGPVKVAGANPDDKLIASQRVLYKSSFNEAIGIPASTLSGEAWFNWYDSDPAHDMRGNWVMVSNVGGEEAEVDISVGNMQTTVVSGRKITPGTTFYWQSPGPLTGGPVRVRRGGLGNSKLVVSQRVLYKDSFEEIAPTYTSQLGSNTDFTWYDNNPANGMGGNWVMATNANCLNGSPVPVSISIPVAGLSDTPIGSPAGCGGQSVWSASGIVTGGPVQVLSGGNKMVISQRVIYKNSFNELVGRPR